jgi:hypothetical protein
MQMQALVVALRARRVENSAHLEEIEGDLAEEEAFDQTSDFDAPTIPRL